MVYPSFDKRLIACYRPEEKAEAAPFRQRRYCSLLQNANDTHLSTRRGPVNSSGPHPTCRMRPRLYTCPAAEDDGGVHTARAILRPQARGQSSTSISRPSLLNVSSSPPESFTSVLPRSRSMRQMVCPAYFSLT